MEKFWLEIDEEALFRIGESYEIEIHPLTRQRRM